jgi:hypothetical protein
MAMFITDTTLLGALSVFERSVLTSTQDTADAYCTYDSPWDTNSRIAPMAKCQLLRSHMLN